jgi:hypothetical protein
VSLAAAAAAAALPLVGHPPIPSPGKGGMDGHPMYPCAKLKLDQLFLQWLSLPESQTLVSLKIDGVLLNDKSNTLAVGFK